MEQKEIDLEGHFDIVLSDWDGVMSFPGYSVCSIPDVAKYVKLVKNLTAPPARLKEIESNREKSLSGGSWLRFRGENSQNALCHCVLRMLQMKPDHPHDDKCIYL
jgi:hypothetical protein